MIAMNTSEVFVLVDNWKNATSACCRESRPHTYVHACIHTFNSEFNSVKLVKLIIFWPLCMWMDCVYRNIYLHTCNYFSPLHVSDTHFWYNQTIKPFHSGVPDKLMLILDLFAEEDPVWIRTELFFGKPFIWCMLHNFGGLPSISGNLTTIATTPTNRCKAC